MAEQDSTAGEPRDRSTAKPAPGAASVTAGGEVTGPPGAGPTVPGAPVPGPPGAGAGAGGLAGGLSDIRKVLSIAPFRRLWICLGLSSLGDWLGLLALTAMAGQLGSGSDEITSPDGVASYMGANFAIAGVLLLRLLPALVFGPFGGYLADKLDRRLVLVAGDVVRFALFLSIPIIGTLWWLFVATVLIEIVSLVWLPAKDATVPNLVPKETLAAANQLFLVTTYGFALPAAALFTLLALINKSLNSLLGIFATPVDLALYINAITFLVGAAVIWTLREVSESKAAREDGSSDNVIRVVLDGWSYVAHTPIVRGLVFGIIGAFAAGGVVIGLGRTFVADLQAGDAGYGVLFGAVFAGLAIGMAIGPRILPGFSRRRLFGLALTSSGVALVGIALIQNIVLVAFFTAVLGFCAGVAWVVGYTMLGLEVEDNVRGRTFAFVHSMTRLALAGVLAAGPLIAGAIGVHSIPLPGSGLTYKGAALTILLAAVVAIVVGVVAFRQMDDRRGVSLWRDLRVALKGGHRGSYTATGLFVAFEGGEGCGKSTQARRVASWLRERGQDVLATHEPGATTLGSHLRGIVLSPETGALSPRTEALLYAADRAEHVDRVIQPALDRGAVVLTDRYVDSSLAYQGSGRELAGDDISRVSQFATRGLRPHLVVVLDLDPEAGLARVQGTPDRLEAESLEFHRRVRQQFLDLAELDPDHYFVVDASLSPEEITERIQARLTGLLPAVGDGRPATPSEEEDESGLDAAADTGPAVDQPEATDAPPEPAYDEEDAMRRSQEVGGQ